MSVTVTEVGVEDKDLGGVLNRSKKAVSFPGGRGGGQGSGWGAKSVRDSWSCGFMTNYAERDTCYYCGADKLA